jgi:hypothetical protein
MTATTWTVKNQTKGTTYSNILSLNFSSGRQTFIDDYSGNTASVTILNNNEATLSVDLGDQIRIYPTVGSSTTGAMVFWVTSFLYNDEPGTMGNSSVTILAEDSIARLGRRRVTNVVTSAGAYVIDQAATMIQTYGNPVNQCFTQLGVSTGSSQTWNGSIADFLRQAVNTEQGFINQSPVTYNMSTADGGRIFINGRRNARTNAIWDFGRTPTSTIIGYQDIQRNKFFDIFANDVTIDPVGLASQQTTNAASVAAYGNYSVSQTSSDQTTTQAAGLSQYLSNVLSDLSLLNIVISFSNKIQDNSDFRYEQFATNIHIMSSYISTLYYRQPGDTVDRSIRVTMTGFSVSATPSETIWTCYFAPMSVYEFFVLNSTTQGLLDASRLGW